MINATNNKNSKPTFFARLANALAPAHDLALIELRKEIQNQRPEPTPRKSYRRTTKHLGHI